MLRVAAATHLKGLLARFVRCLVNMNVVLGSREVLMLERVECALNRTISLVDKRRISVLHRNPIRRHSRGRAISGCGDIPKIEAGGGV